MLIEIIGSWKSGKTLLATLLAKLASKQYVIRANYNLYQVDNFYHLRIEDLFSLKREKTVVILDEAYTWLESRTSMNQLNRLMSQLLFQSRKRHNHFITTTQIENTIDTRFRQMSEIVIKSKRKEKGYYYTVYHVKSLKNLKGTTLKQKGTWMISNEHAKKIFPLYDTYEIVQTENTKDLLINNMSRKTINELSEKLAIKMFEIRKKWSRSLVKQYLIKNEQSPKFSEYVYYVLKELEEKQKEVNETKKKQREKEEEKEKQKQNKLKQIEEKQKEKERETLYV